jgi:hypothetical protein
VLGIFEIVSQKLPAQNLDFKNNLNS